MNTLAEKTDLYRSLFLEAVQRTRGYFYLVNVVMSAEAYEVMYQSNKLADFLGAEMVSTEDRVLNGIHHYLTVVLLIGFSLLVLTSLVSYFVSQSIASPIDRLTAIFGDLARGSQRKGEVVAHKADEISKLASAAQMFRNKNIETQSLLERYKSLSEALEDQVRQRTAELEQKNSELNRLAITDPLTKLYNRLKINEVIQGEIKRYDRYGEPMSVILLDIDFFKSVNDRYGHQVGDQVLQTVSRVLIEQVREVDIVGRWGGEEFMVVCPETDSQAAALLAEKLTRIFHKFAQTLLAP